MGNRAFELVGLALTAGLVGFVLGATAGVLVIDGDDELKTIWVLSLAIVGGLAGLVLAPLVAGLVLWRQTRAASREGSQLDALP